MEFDFYSLHFSEKDGILSAGAFQAPDCAIPVTAVRIAGQDIASPSPAKQPFAGGRGVLRFVQAIREVDTLTIVQESDLCRTETTFRYEGGGIGVSAVVTNISSREIVLEGVSVLDLSGISLASRENTCFYRFSNSHHCECQPRRIALSDAGLFECGHRTFKRICGCNTGSWSSKEELPECILEDAEHGLFLMFQIESNGSWYWEIGEGVGCKLYLSVGGGNFASNGWKKRLAPQQSYASPKAALALGKSLNEVLQKMTLYRRATASFGRADSDLPVIFNEYMHLSWDSPEEERTKKMAEAAAECGADVYVIDCGWHDEADGNKIYPYVGAWRESHIRFPHGVRTATDHIRSLGMKAGLWIEPEVVGSLSGVEYPEDAYIRTNGERVLVAGRYFLDYRHPEVRRKMSEAIDRMVNEYGAQYIKIDCNQDCGVGTEVDSDSPGEGLEQTTQAFWSWLQGEREKHPSVIFESCASGGMRMDWKSIRTSSVISASDQVLYDRLPYIVTNIFAAALPEQTGIWSYPVVDSRYCDPTGRPTDSEVIMNMVNAALGRVHLASDLRKLTERQREWVKEGIYFSKSQNAFRRSAVPVLPFGFAKFGMKYTALGLTDGKKMLLAVWNFQGGKLDVPLEGYTVKEAAIAYPKDSSAALTIQPAAIRVETDEMASLIIEVRLSS